MRRGLKVELRTGVHVGGGGGLFVCLFVRPSRGTHSWCHFCAISNLPIITVSCWPKIRGLPSGDGASHTSPPPLSPCPPVPVPRPSVSQLANKWPTYRCQHEHVSSLNKRRPLLAFLAECRSQFSRPAQHSCQDTRQRARLTPRLLTGREQMLLSAALPKLQDHSYDASALKCTFHIYSYVKSVQK